MIHMYLHIMRQGASFDQQFILQKRLSKFVYHEDKSATKEVYQLQIWCCFQPIGISEFTEEEKRKVYFLQEK